MSSLLPTLELISGEKEQETEAVVFRGAKGVKTAFNELVDSLKKGDSVNIMGVHGFATQFRPLSIYFQKIRSAKGIRANFLINRHAREIADLFSNYPPLEIRWMDEGMVTPVVFLIYNDNVVFNLGDELVFFRLRSKRMADAFNVYFRRFWDSAEKYRKSLGKNTSSLP
jgi:hypothetical protein